MHLQQPASELVSAEELEELARSAGLTPVACLASARRRPHPSTWVGQGKAQEIKALAEARQASVIVFSDDLSPTQERNLEKLTGARALGRTGLILEIFARRARTHEGKLQVELAQLRHLATRLVRGWTHLDRQRGGSGRAGGGGPGLGGAGEKQLEADQRLVGAQIKRVQARLARVRQQRALNRRSRRRSAVQTVSLVGYTNAGKSTLFNRLCAAGVYAQDQLFATLDPTLRQVQLPVLGRAILTDTVGFIRQLPHTLVDAFRATLEEVSQADLILHLVDAAAPLRHERIDAVNAVLAEIGADALPQLLVYNKVDLMDAQPPKTDYGPDGLPSAVWLSAATGAGCERLPEALAQRLARDVTETQLTLGPADGRARARLHQLGAVLHEATNEDGSISLSLRIQKRSLKKILAESRIPAGTATPILR